MGPIEFAKDRFKGPIIGVFYVSWSLWNWKVYLYFFSGLSPQVKISQIDQQLGLCALLAPMCLTGFYIFVYPWIADFVHKYHHAYRRVRLIRDYEIEIDKKDKEELRIDGRETLKIIKQAFRRLEADLSAMENLLREVIAPDTERQRREKTQESLIFLMTEWKIVSGHFKERLNKVEHESKKFEEIRQRANATARQAIRG